MFKNPFFEPRITEAIENSLSPILARYHGAKAQVMFPSTVFDHQDPVLGRFWTITADSYDMYDLIIEDLRLLPLVESAYITPPATTAAILSNWIKSTARVP